MMTKIKEGERLDDLGRRGYQIIQDPKRFCFGIDAVLLTGFARIKDGDCSWSNWGGSSNFIRGEC